MRLRLPPEFYRDHESRDLPSGDVIRHTKRYVEIEATEAEAKEILSDARFYSDQYGPSEISFGLKSSAAATVRSIEQQAPALA